MATLNSTYQYIGRTSGVSSERGWNFYVLLYAKTTGDISTGKHTVGVKMRLVCDVASTFYGYLTDGSVKVNGVSAIYWDGVKVPDAAWNTTSITEGGITYPRWIDLREGTAVVDVGFGAAKDVQITASWQRNAISGTIPAWLPYTTTISANITVTLPMIASASAITAAGNVTLGNACSVTWTPQAASFRYKLKFSIGNWSYTTGVIHPNKTTAYTYSEYVIPIDVANQVPTKTGTMTATLYAYSDSAATVQIGSATTRTFTVTVPDNSTTKPTVTMTLTPVGNLPSAFSGLYLQGQTKVKATLSATGKYGADIDYYTMKVDGVAYGSGQAYTSGYLTEIGSRTVYGYATDKRTHTGEAQKTITVIAYSKPKLENVSAYRCDKDGNASDTGTYLKIKAKRGYSPVLSGGVQKNFCKIQYQYKKEGGSFSSWETILESSSLTSDEVVTAPRLNGYLVATSNYIVQIRAIDDVGNYAMVTVYVPSDKIYSHENGEINSFGFGTYVEEPDTFLLAEDITLKAKGEIAAKNIRLLEQDIFVGGDLNTYYPVHFIPGNNTNAQPTFLGIGKALGTTSPAWEGNHNEGTSSLMIGWEFRYNGWDGNGRYLNTLYKCEDYAKLIAHVEGYGSAARGVVAWLRGGGAAYKIACSLPVTINVHLEETNIANASSNTLMVSPREYTGNYGILYIGTCVADRVIEEGTSGIWSYRKWYSGKAECWGRKEYTLDITSAWGVLFESQTVQESFIPGFFAYDPVTTLSATPFAYAVMIEYVGLGDKNHAPSWCAVRPNSQPNVSFYMTYHAQGRWI